MSPADRNLVRNIALSILAPGSGIYRDGVREALAVVDAETARALNAPRDKTVAVGGATAPVMPLAEAVRKLLRQSDIGIPITEQNQGVGGELKIQPSSPVETNDMATMRHIRQAHRPLLDALAAQPVGLFAQLTPEQQRQALEYTGDELIGPRRSPAPSDTIVAEVRADLLARSEMGIAKYGVTLDRTDLGHVQWLQHGYEEALDLACYLKRAMRDANAAPAEPPHAAAPVLATLTPEPAEAVLGRAGEALAGVEVLPEFVLAKPNTTTWHPYGGDAYPLTTDGVQRIFPTKEAALRWEALKAHSGEALAGSLPVYVLAGTGRHPYGDDAWHMETDGVARLFPSKDAAQRWLAAMGKAPV